jgi:biotin transport system ATP-binding protein
MKSILEIDHLTFSITAKHPILSDVSCSVRPGSFAVLSGRNGTGKSILLRCIKGLLQPTGGLISINGTNLTKKPTQRNHSVGLVFQDADTQIVGQTVERDIRFGMENLGLSLDEQSKRLNETVQLLGMESVLHQRPHTLSGGERRKLAIAGVLVMQPQLLMLDEPFANLDYLGIISVLESLRTLHEQGTTIVVATHEIEKLLAHADALLVLDAGKMVVNGHPAEVIDTIEQYGIRRPKYRQHPIPVGDLTWLN